MTLLSPLEAEQRSLTLTAHLSLASLLNSLQRARAWQPLNLGSLLRAPLLQNLRRWPQRFLTGERSMCSPWGFAGEQFGSGVRDVGFPHPPVCAGEQFGSGVGDVGFPPPPSPSVCW